jgi:hypothetical protein
VVLSRRSVSWSIDVDGDHTWDGLVLSCLEDAASVDREGSGPQGQNWQCLLGNPVWFVVSLV